MKPESYIRCFCTPIREGLRKGADWKDDRVTMHPGLKAFRKMMSKNMVDKGVGENEVCTYDQASHPFSFTHIRHGKSYLAW